MIINETAAEYHAREAVSASLLWDIVKPSGCLAKARYQSQWLNPDYVEPPNHDLDFGTIVHLAVLESDLLESRVRIVTNIDNWRTNAAIEIRDEAYASGKIPILAGRTRKTAKSLYTMDEVFSVRKALEQSEAAELLFGEGESEVSYTWDLPWPGTVPFMAPMLGTAPPLRMPCKARADRTLVSFLGNTIVDLKTAESASWDAFQRAMERDGHFMRAAWYIDGWTEQPEYDETPAYKFIVVEKSPPYLSAIWEVDDRALEWGRRWYKRGLAQLREAFETDVWSSYVARGEPKNRKVPLRGFLEWDYADLEKAGLL